MNSEDAPLKLTAARARPRGEVVYKALLRAIRQGQIRPGERIREEDVADLLGVSRTPVREALQQLQARRLVELVPGRGNVVVELSLHQAMELYAMRELLEGAAAGFAAQHAQAAEIALMHRLLEAFEAALEGDTATLIETNRQLHRTIHLAARNRYMHEALGHLDDTLSLLQGTTFEIAHRRPRAAAEHRAIVEAIAARDAKAAEAASRAHIREALSARLQMRPEA
jgi:DNA-binding GntR family transcriptional regulator